MLLNQVIHQLWVPGPVLAANGGENWSPLAMAEDPAVLRQVVKDQGLTRFALVAGVAYEVGQPPAIPGLILAGGAPNGAKLS